VRLRPLVEADLDVLCGFFASPHVEHWWHTEASPDAVRARYLEPADDPTVLLMALEDERPVGFAEWYLWDDFADSRDAYGIPSGAVGFDYLVGHPHDCDRGVGTALVAALLEATPPVPVWVTPEAANEPSCRVLEKNGFERMAVKQCHVPDEPWAGPTALYRLQR
jgi:aminoglycoside 6'-N-acetyltransferase